ncbi:MAG TPA: ATP-binding protein [Anaerolineae bacterium]|nr:ATP-binding protein [Anaerolineae bacterium]
MPTSALSLHRGLRAKIALGVALPIFVVLLSLSLFHTWRERHLVETQIESAALQMGEMTLGSLRHAMATGDDAALKQILSDVSRLDNIRQVQIIGLDGRVKANSLGRRVDEVQNLDQSGCVECHPASGEATARTARLPYPSGTLRVSLPIRNEADCAGCHAQPNALLGTLLVDVSVADVEKHLLDDLRVDLLLTGGITILATLGIYVLIHRMVVRRIGAMQRPLDRFARGSFGARMPVSLNPSDEIDALADAFNHMADELQRHAREQEERGQVRQRAIVEERERIARELHDGMAQVLGYVSTKAMAARLMLKKQRSYEAEQHLLQLEEAAQRLFVDVREAILGLKMAGQNGIGLSTALREYTTQYHRLTGIPVDLSIDPAAESMSLPAETELQLVRIVQEALANVRKHASARRAAVGLHRKNGALELIVQDDGVGFDPDQARSAARSQSRFGLGTMRERADAIGAHFALNSEPGAGTCICVRLKVLDSEV